MPEQKPLVSKLKFKPQPMVGWYDAAQLANTGIKAVVSSLFGSYADKREMMSAISQPKIDDYSTQDEVWIDYISDLGDGFDSTYTMASLLAASSLAVKEDKAFITFPKAKVLILGGDLVYPTASREEYNNRFIGPYEEAFPRNRDKEVDDIFAIPGNHDWYDGLTNFSKLFFQDRTIGNWRTKQNRSYFAIRITCNTWIWAIDIQLEADIDKPQLDYFDWVKSNNMNKYDKVILCSAEPSWIYSNTKQSDTSYHNLCFFEKKFFCDQANPDNKSLEDDKQLELIISLAGDLHHYARYTKSDPETGKTFHKITSGGGGAFMHPTHNLLDKLVDLREGDFELKKTFPSKAQSKKMLWGNIWFPFINWHFGFFMGTIYLLFSWITEITSRLAGINLVEKIKIESNLAAVLKLYMKTFYYSPFSLIIIVVLILGLGAFCDTASSKSRRVVIIGYLHGCCHVISMCMLLWLFAYINQSIFNFLHPELHTRGWMTCLLLLEIFVIGGYWASVLIGAYLMIANRFFRIHDNESFSSLKISNWKNFLKFHFKDGLLTIYPVGVKKTATWDKTKTPFTTKNTVAPELIESPILINLK